MKRFTYKLLVAILLTGTMLIPSLLKAQSPRMVIVEEATNASCPPCAAQNPFFEAYLAMPHNVKMIIPITYHANYPGTDVMNAANPTMHNGRVTYYSSASYTPHITGVPTAIVNGIVPNKSPNYYDGAPSDTVALSNAVMAAQGMSPITITINETRTGLTSDVSVVVTSTQDLANKTLQIVAVESEHHYTSAGTNGEKDFPAVARLMLPSQTGTPISLVAGQPQTFNQTYTINSGWNADEMYLVVFVQDDISHEILQGADNKGKVVAVCSTPTTLVQSTPGTPAMWQGTVVSNNTAMHHVTITKTMPVDWTAELRINGTVVANGDSMNLTGLTPATMTVQFTPGASPKPAKGTATVVITGPKGANSTQTFKYYTSGADVLVFVKDEGNAAIATSYDKGLAATTIPYLVVDNGDEAYFTWKDYDVVMYEVGKGIVDGDQVAQLKSYLDGGGRLYLIGAEIAWGLCDAAAASSGYYADIPFVRDYLHSDYKGDTGPNFNVYGLSGDPVSNGLNFNISQGVPNQDTPDELKARPTAQPIFYYGLPVNNRQAGIRFADSKYRLVYLGFGLEGIASTATAGTIMKQGIEWLRGEGTTATPVDPTASTLSLGSNIPNPTSGVVDIPFSVASTSMVNIALYDVRGSLVSTVASKSFEAGSHSVRFDATQLPTGLYNVVMTTPTGSRTNTLTVVH